MHARFFASNLWQFLLALPLTLALISFTPAYAETWAESLKRQADEMAKKLGEAAKLPAAGQAAAPPSAPAQTTPRLTRPAASLRTLMNRTVTGDELITELKAIQIAMREQRAAKSMADFTTGLGQAANQIANPGKVDIGRWLGNLGAKAAQNVLKDASGKIAYQALDDFLFTLTEDPKLLQRETVQMPAAKNMSDTQIQGVVTMAALVVTARANGKLLEQAKKDIAGIEDDYKRLIERREQAAKVLYEVMGLRAQAQRDGNTAALREANAQFGESLSQSEMTFLEADLSRT